MAFVVGVTEQVPIKNAPSEVEAALASKAGRPLAKQDVAELLMDLNASALNFEGHTFDATAAPALGECIAKSLNLTELSLRGVRSSDAISVSQLCADALVENLSVQRVDLTGCGLTAAEATALAENVLPWNHTVIDWDLSDNPELGTAGVTAFVDGLLASTASIQRLNLRNTGLTDVAGIGAKLEKLTCLYQIDLAGNPGTPLTVKQATDLHVVLLNNAALLRPNVDRKLVPLVDGAGDGRSPVKQEAPAPAPAPAASESPAKDQGSPRSLARQRSASSMRRPRGNSRAASPPPMRKVESEAQLKKEKQTEPQSPPPKQPAPAPAASTSSSPAQQPKPTSPEPQRSENGAAPPPARQAPAPEPQVRRPEPRPATARASGRNSPARSSSAASVTRGRSTTRLSGVYGSPARSSTPAQRDVTDGADEWRKKRNEYNQFIRCGSPSASRSGSPARALNKPKYVLGKRVDDSPRPSSTFVAPQGRARERMPTPAEVRKYAPWNQKAAEGETSVGGVRKVVVEDADGRRPATVITFVDGGRQTYLEEDPRDMGYQARKIQTGQVKPSGTLYRSNTPRDLRFGTTFHDKGYVHPQAQAPGPGAYHSTESEWEKRARQLRERARAVSGTGRPVFGASAAPRSQAPPKKDMDRPGPGEYEIP